MKSNRASAVLVLSQARPPSQPADRRREQEALWPISLTGSQSALSSVIERPSERIAPTDVDDRRLDHVRLADRLVHLRVREDLSKQRLQLVATADVRSSIRSCRVVASLGGVAMNSFQSFVIRKRAWCWLVDHEIHRVGHLEVLEHAEEALRVRRTNGSGSKELVALSGSESSIRPARQRLGHLLDVVLCCSSGFRSASRMPRQNSSISSRA